jgi:hypothetical protein
MDRAHVSFGQLQRGADFSSRIIEDVSQEQHRALRRRQRLERLQERQRRAFHKIVPAFERLTADARLERRRCVFIVLSLDRRGSQGPI